MYKIFRILVGICLTIIVVISIAYFSDKIADKSYAICSGITALVAAFFSIFSSKPIQKHDVASAIDQLLSTYDAETFGALKDAKEQEQKIKEFIDVKSNQLFLLKHREYLEEEIINKYRGSDLEKMIDEIVNVENRLLKLNVDFEEIDLPEKFKSLLADLVLVKKREQLLEFIDAIPYLPMKKLLKFQIRWKS